MQRKVKDFAQNFCNKEQIKNKMRKTTHCQKIEKTREALCYKGF